MPTSEYTMDYIKTNPQLHTVSLDTGRRRDKRDRELIKADIVLFVMDFWDDHGYAPSLRDIMMHLEILSISTTRNWVNELIREGRLASTGAPSRYLIIPAIGVANANKL